MLRMLRGLGWLDEYLMLRRLPAVRARGALGVAPGCYWATTLVKWGAQVSFVQEKPCKQHCYM